MIITIKFTGEMRETPYRINNLSECKNRFKEIKPRCFESPYSQDSEDGQKNILTKVKSGPGPGPEVSSKHA